MSDAIPKFYTGEYAAGSTSNVAQRVVRNLLAREAIMTGDSEGLSVPPRPRPISVALEPTILDPLRGSRKVALGVNKVSEASNSEQVVAERLAQQYYDSIPRAPVLPATRLTTLQIQARDRDFKLRVQQAIQKEQFLREYSFTIEVLSQTRVCSRCRQHFSLLEGIGAWSCRFHYKSTHTNRAWDCCTRPFVPSVELPERAATNGGYAFSCTPIDHVDFELFDSGVSNGMGVWKIPVAVKPCFERRNFWVIFDNGIDEDRFTDVWDITSGSDMDSSSLLKGLTGPGLPTLEELDQDDDARVQLETKVRNGRWATSTEETVERVTNPRFVLGAPVQINEKVIHSNNSRASQESSKRYFYVPSSPAVAGPREFLGSSPSHLLIGEGPRRDRRKT